MGIWYDAGQYVLSACQPVEKTSKNADEASAQTDQKREVTFPFPQIPALLTDAEQRKEYLLKHYWDNFDFQIHYWSITGALVSKGG